MLFAVFFAFWRIMEIITLIPTMGMLAYFVNGYVQANALTPNYILILFIVSVLALAWAIFTIFSYHRSTNGLFIALVDLGFVGAFIAAVYYLRFMAKADCTNISMSDNTHDFSFIIGTASINGVDVSVDRTCAMLKACFAFGIMNCIFFFITAVLAYLHHDRAPPATSGKTYYRETSYRSGSRGHHHHHHRRSHSGSRRSSRSHHRTAYV